MIRLKYFDSIRHLLRAGTVDDPYVLKVTQEKIVNNKINLDEIPDPMYHVRIEGYTELDRNVYYKTKEIPSDKFYIEYDNGVVYFNLTEDGKTVTVEYKGRGVLQFPAERIYIHSPNPWAVDNLQELIDFIYQKEQELKDAVANAIAFMEQKKNEFVEYINTFIARAEEKINLIDIHIDISKKQTEACKTATEESIVVTGESRQATLDSITATNKANMATQNSIKATNECIDVTNKAITETNNMKVDRFNTRLIWKEPSETFANISIDYPNPEIGWVVMSLENGNLYRYDGIVWRYIGNMKGGIPLSSDTTDGLMSKEDYIKLLGIEEKAQKNYIGEEAKNALPDYVHTKTIVFVMPINIFKVGVQDIVISFPNDGVIKKITGICQVEGNDFTSIQIQKISETDYKNKNENAWIDICENGKELIFPYSEKIALLPNILEKNVSKNDCFRLKFNHVGYGIENITVNIEILI